MKPEHSNIQTYREHIDDIINSAELISVIYNYCDRWCERCEYTDKCSIYYFEEEEKQNGGSEKQDLDRISEIFTLTMEMLNEIAEEYGLDFDELPDMDVEEHIPGKFEMMAIEYGNSISQWLKENKLLLEEKAKNMSIIDKNQANIFSEVIQIINWYSFTIGAKIHRASVNDKIDYESEEEYNKRDQVGSAKIAIISIDRSMNAMRFILNNIPEKEEDSLNYLAKLQKIKQGVLSTIPNAMDFVRPGFDE